MLRKLFLLLLTEPPVTFALEVVSVARWALERTSTYTFVDNTFGLISLKMAVRPSRDIAGDGLLR